MEFAGELTLSESSETGAEIFGQSVIGKRFLYIPRQEPVALVLEGVDTRLDLYIIIIQKRRVQDED